MVALKFNLVALDWQDGLWLISIVYFNAITLVETTYVGLVGTDD